MGLESGATIASLNASWPLGSDPKSQGDDHLRLVKAVVKADAVSLSEPTRQVLASALAVAAPLTVTYAPAPGPQGGTNAKVGGYAGTDTAYLSVRTAADAVVAEVRAAFAGGVTALQLLNNAGEVLRLSPTQGLVMNMGTQAGGVNVTAVWDGTSRHVVRATTSEAAAKANVVPLAAARTGGWLEQVLALEPVLYDDIAHVPNPDDPGHDRNRQWAGFMVDDAEALGFEGAIGYNGPDAGRSLDYARIVPYLVAAVQELAARVEALEGA